MLFVQGFLLVASILLLLFIAVYALNHLETPGSLSLLFLMIGAIIWTAASLMELVSHTFEAMLFWRNIQQIGVFSVPITTLFSCCNQNMIQFIY
jgi:multisubunit Na+/H+ antiporter MnhG subunit